MLTFQVGQERTLKSLSTGSSFWSRKGNVHRVDSVGPSQSFLLIQFSFIKMQMSVMSYRVTESWGETLQFV